MTSLRHGTLLSFDAATWTAQVLLEGADAEAQIPVAQFVPPAHLVANVEVAVLLFDPTNPDDAVVLGAYGSAGDWTLPALNAGAPEAAATGEIHSSGDLQVERGGAGEAFVRFYRPGAAAGHRRIRAGFTNDDAFIVQALNDDGTWQADLLKIYRSGGGDAVLSAGSLNLNAANLTYKVNATQVVAARKTGWAAATNTKTRTTFDTTTVTLPVLAAHVGALIDDLISHGLIGP